MKNQDVITAGVLCEGVLLLSASPNMTNPLGVRWGIGASDLKGSEHAILLYEMGDKLDSETADLCGATIRHYLDDVVGEGATRPPSGDERLSTLWLRRK
jgi:hypothetical protein